MANQMVDNSSQTDNEVHDIFYYKNRAYKAEEALLLLKKVQHISRLQAELHDLERETTTKLHLYSHDTERVQQLQQQFQQATLNKDRLCAKAEEVFAFNLHSLRNGHELNELPRVDDAEVDLSAVKLGPVTPTIGPRGPLIPFEPPHAPSLPSRGPFTQSQQSLVYPLYRPPESHRLAYMGSEQAGSVAMPMVFPHHPSTSSAIQSNVLPGAELNSFGLNGHHSSEGALPLMQPPPARLPATTQVPLSSNGGMFFGSHTYIPSTVNGSFPPPFSSVKPPDVIPKQPSLDRPAIGDQDLTGYNPQHDLSITGAMGLDSLNLDYSMPNGFHGDATKVRWSHVAASGLDAGSGADAEWQAVGSRKTKPSSYKKQPGQAPFTAPAGLFIRPLGAVDSDDFEKVVENAMERFQLTRPEVITALQKVRNDRNGDIRNISLQDMMKEAERLLLQNKSGLKTTNLSARARAVADHPEPCDNQLCPARLKLLKYRTELCLSYQTSKTCYMKPGSCVYAHGEAELRPLPKEELCERYLEGKCNNAKCVYAHGVSELKNRPVFNPADYINRKSKKAMNGSTASKPPTDELALTAADYDPQGEECSICFETMSKKSRRAIECGHDSFHYKCLKRWAAAEGDGSCPLCRSNPLRLEEYPKLSAR